jgi:hypothetical protein
MCIEEWVGSCLNMERGLLRQDASVAFIEGVRFASHFRLANSILVEVERQRAAFLARRRCGNVIVSRFDGNHAHESVLLERSDPLF